MYMHIGLHAEVNLVCPSPCVLREGLLLGPGACQLDQAGCLVSPTDLPVFFFSVVAFKNSLPCLAFYWI